MNTLAGDVRTEPAQFRNFPSLLTGPENLSELESSVGAPICKKMPIDRDDVNLLETFDMANGRVLYYNRGATFWPKRVVTLTALLN